MAFRRLAHHRSWFLICFGLIGLALVTLFILDRTVYSKRFLTGEELLAPLFGYPFALLVLVRGITGSWSRWQLRVDIPAGLFHFQEGKVVPLAELGELAIKTEPYRSGRNVHTNYQLRTAGFDRAMFSSLFEGETKLRLDRLQLAVLHSALRRVLETPVVDSDAFRAGPDVASEVARIAGDSPYRMRALAALARDHDATIRGRAAALVASASPRATRA